MTSQDICDAIPLILQWYVSFKKKTYEQDLNRLLRHRKNDVILPKSAVTFL